MISMEEFKQLMKETCLLTGQKPPVEQMQAIYMKIKNFDIRDFKEACNDDELLDELTFYGMNYPSIKRAIEKYCIARLEREHAEANRRETEKLKKSLSIFKAAISGKNSSSLCPMLKLNMSISYWDINRDGRKGYNDEVWQVLKGMISLRK